MTTLVKPTVFSAPIAITGLTLAQPWAIVTPNGYQVASDQVKTVATASVG